MIFAKSLYFGRTICDGKLCQNNPYMFKDAIIHVPLICGGVGPCPGMGRNVDHKALNRKPNSGDSPKGHAFSENPVHPQSPQGYIPVCRLVQVSLQQCFALVGSLGANYLCNGALHFFGVQGLG